MNESCYNINLITLLRLEGLGLIKLSKLTKYLYEDYKLVDLQNLIFNHLAKKYSIQELESANSHAYKIVEVCNENSISILTESKLPTLLDNLKNPPVILYCLGNPPIDSDDYTTVIGTRKPSYEAINATKIISTQLIERNDVIISGLALGVDIVAHNQAVKHKKPTIAILGSGVLKPYPPQNIKTAKEIVENQGCLLSEYEPTANMQNYMLVARDRIQAGISKKLVLIQSKLDGGSMHATKTMIGLGRPVYYVNYEGVTDVDVSGNVSLINTENCIPINYSELLKNLDCFTTTYLPSKNQQDSFNF